MSEEHLLALKSGVLHRFSDWKTSEVPNHRAGVYTVWSGPTLIYVGMAGRGLAKDSHLVPTLPKRMRGLKSRLASHASGRRSGDQFCIYVADRLVLPTLSPGDIANIAENKLSFDLLTRTYIHDHMEYRFVITDDGVEAFLVERQVQKGALDMKPVLNPAE